MPTSSDIGPPGFTVHDHEVDQTSDHEDLFDTNLSSSSNSPPPGFVNPLSGIATDRNGRISLSPAELVQLVLSSQSQSQERGLSPNRTYSPDSLKGLRSTELPLLSASSLGPSDRLVFLSWKEQLITLLSGTCSWATYLFLEHHPNWEQLYVKHEPLSPSTPLSFDELKLKSYDTAFWTHIARCVNKNQTLRRFVSQPHLRSRGIKTMRELSLKFNPLNTTLEKARVWDVLSLPIYATKKIQHYFLMFDTAVCTLSSIGIEITDAHQVLCVTRAYKMDKRFDPFSDFLSVYMSNNNLDENHITLDTLKQQLFRYNTEKNIDDCPPEPRELQSAAQFISKSSLRDCSKLLSTTLRGVMGIGTAPSLKSKSNKSNESTKQPTMRHSPRFGCFHCGFYSSDYSKHHGSSSCPRKQNPQTEEGKKQHQKYLNYLKEQQNKRKNTNDASSNPSSSPSSTSFQQETGNSPTRTLGALIANSGELPQDNTSTVNHSLVGSSAWTISSQSIRNTVSSLLPKNDSYPGTILGIPDTGNNVSHSFPDNLRSYLRDYVVLTPQERQPLSSNAANNTPMQWIGKGTLNALVRLKSSRYIEVDIPVVTSDSNQFLLSQRVLASKNHSLQLSRDGSKASLVLDIDGDPNDDIEGEVHEGLPTIRIFPTTIYQLNADKSSTPSLLYPPIEQLSCIQLSARISPSTANSHAASLHTWHLRCAHLSEKEILRVAPLVQDMEITDTKITPQPSSSCIPCVMGDMSRSNISRTAKDIHYDYSTWHWDSLPIKREQLRKKDKNIVLARSSTRQPSTGAHVGIALSFATDTKFDGKEILDKWGCLLKIPLSAHGGLDTVTNFFVDGASCYTKGSFARQAQAMGITIDHTSPGTPETNGLCERFLAHLCNATITSLHWAGLDHRFITDAILDITRKLNLLPPQKASVSPMMHLTRDSSKCSWKHEKVFGCVALVLIPKGRRNKFEPHALEAINLGHLGNGLYSLYNVATGRTMESRHVIHLEDKKGGLLLGKLLMSPLPLSTPVSEIFKDDILASRVQEVLDEIKNENCSSLLENSQLQNVNSENSVETDHVDSSLESAVVIDSAPTDPSTSILLSKQVTSSSPVVTAEYAASSSTSPSNTHPSPATNVNDIVLPLTSDSIPTGSTIRKSTRSNKGVPANHYRDIYSLNELHSIDSSSSPLPNIHNLVQGIRETGTTHTPEEDDSILQQFSELVSMYLGKQYYVGRHIGALIGQKSISGTPEEFPSPDHFPIPKPRLSDSSDSSITPLPTSERDKLLSQVPPSLSYDKSAIPPDVARNIPTPSSSFDLFKNPIHEPWKKHWIDAMNSELRSFLSLGVMSPTPSFNIPEDAEIIQGTWSFKCKLTPSFHVDKFKARYCARGDLMDKTLYPSTFSPTAYESTTNMLFHIGATRSDFVTLRFDISSAYLNSAPSRRTFIRTPHGINWIETSHLELLGNIYGKIEAGRRWYQHLNNTLVNIIGDTRSSNDECLYFNKDPSMLLIGEHPISFRAYAINVDDILITGTHKLVEQWAIAMKEHYDLVQVGDLFLGLRVRVHPNGISLDQEHYIDAMLKELNLQDINPRRTPLPSNFDSSSSSCPVLGSKEYLEMKSHKYPSLVGKVMWPTKTHPETKFATSTLGQHLANPGLPHIKGVKHLMAYLKGTKHFGLFFHSDSSDQLRLFTDADWAGDKTTRKSQAGIAIFLGKNLVFSSSTRIKHRTDSSSASELSAIYLGVRELISIRRIATELGLLSASTPLPTPTYVDNQSAINVTTGKAGIKKHKHMQLKYLSLRDLYSSQVFDLVKVPTNHQLADMFTKNLPTNIFLQLRHYFTYNLPTALDDTGSKHGVPHL